MAQPCSIWLTLTFADKTVREVAIAGLSVQARERASSQSMVVRRQPDRDVSSEGKATGLRDRTGKPGKTAKVPKSVMAPKLEELHKPAESLKIVKALEPAESQELMKSDKLEVSHKSAESVQSLEHVDPVKAKAGKERKDPDQGTQSLIPCSKSNTCTDQALSDSQACSACSARHRSKAHLHRADALGNLR